VKNLPITINGRAVLLQRRSRLGAIERMHLALGSVDAGFGDSNMAFVFDEQI